MPYINLLIKPASSLCNMRCRYCFYADEAANRELPSMGVMTASTAEMMIARAAPRLREIAEAEKKRCSDNRKRPTSGRCRSFLRLIIVQKFAKAGGKKLSVQSAKVAGGHALRLAEHPVEAADRAEAALLGHLRDGQAAAL